MRFRQLILWDMRFQARYGFYLLYGFLTVLYVVLLLSLPQAWKENAAAMLIFSDPAAMGLFFIGAIVLLEKSQRVTSFFGVSPLRALEYVGSKVLSGEESRVTVKNCTAGNKEKAFRGSGNGQRYSILLRGAHGGSADL